LKRPVVQTYKVSKTFNAPLEFAFDWCTDFREDDGKMTGSKAKRHFLERTKDRIIWTVKYTEEGKPKEGVRAVWLSPPDSWHLDTCGDHREIGDYRLSRVGKDKTRLDMVFHMTYDDPRQVVDKEQWEKEALEEWGIFSKFLESDYKASIAR
jgi:hypothetical protein